MNKISRELLKIAREVKALDEEGDEQKEMLNRAQKEGKKYILHHKAQDYRASEQDAHSKSYISSLESCWCDNKKISENIRKAFPILKMELLKMTGVKICRK